jgi:hypothetical protein
MGRVDIFRFTRVAHSSFHRKELVGSHGNGGGSSSHALHWFSSKMIQMLFPKRGVR